MNNIKKFDKFNEELDNKTYQSAIDKLKEKGQNKRAERMQDTFYDLKSTKLPINYFEPKVSGKGFHDAKKYEVGIAEIIKHNNSDVLTINSDGLALFDITGDSKFYQVGTNRPAHKLPDRKSANNLFKLLKEWENINDFIFFTNLNRNNLYAER